MRTLHCKPGSFLTPRGMCRGSHTARHAQLLIKLQAERPEFRWRDKLAAARKADSARRRRGRAKSASKAAAASEQERNQAALAQLAGAPSALPSRLRTEEWIAWRQWRAYVQYQKQLRSSASGKRDGSHCMHKEPVSLERSLESELIQAAGELAGGAGKRDTSQYKEPKGLESSLESKLTQAADELDGSNLGPSIANGAMPASVVASVSPSHIARTDSHALLERLKKDVHKGTRVSDTSPQSAPTVDSRNMTWPSRNLHGGADSKHMTSPSRRPHAGAGSQYYKLLRRCWQAWRDWLYSIALEQLALVETPPVESAAGTASPAKAAEGTSLASNDPAPSVELRAENTLQPPSDHWDAINENLRRCGRRRSHNYKATSHAHFLMRRARTRSTGEAELRTSSG